MSKVNVCSVVSASEEAQDELIQSPVSRFSLKLQLALQEEKGIKNL